MAALDPLEQGHAAALHAEHADAIGDLGPFGVEIGSDEAGDSGRTWSVARFRHAPLDDPSRASVTALDRIIVRPGKIARWRAASARSAGLA